MPRFDRGVESIDAPPRHQGFGAVVIRIDGNDAPAVAVLCLPPELISFRKQPAGIEGYHVDGKCERDLVF